MAEVTLNPDQASRLSELIQTIPKPLPSAFEALVEALSEACDEAADSGEAYIDITVQSEEEE